MLKLTTYVKKVNMERKDMSSEVQNQMRPCWSTLSDEKKAFVVAYLDNGYSVGKASEATRIDLSICKRYLQIPSVRVAIKEIQSEMDDLDFLNEKWVKTQLMMMFPKVIGEEPVPYVNSEGTQIEARRFYPDIAMKIMEYIVPKDSKSNTSGDSNFSINISLDNGN